MGRGGKLRVAVVGVGRMGQSYAQAYATFPDTDLVALVDNNQVTHAMQLLGLLNPCSSLACLQVAEVHCRHCGPQPRPHNYDMQSLRRRAQERAAAACERFGCPAHFCTVEEMLAAAQPEVVSVVTPGAYFKSAVLACAAAPSVKASTRPRALLIAVHLLRVHLLDMWDGTSCSCILGRKNTNEDRASVDGLRAAPSQ